MKDKRNYSNLLRKAALLLAAFFTFASFVWAQSVKQDLKKAGKKTGEAGKEVGKAGAKVGKEVGKTGKTVGKKVGKAGKEIGQDIGKSFKKLTK